MDEHSDPLADLRHMAAGGTGVARELRRIAIAWDNERCRNNIDRRVLQAKYEAECSANDRLRTEVKWLTAERDELMAKLDASMPLPIDADGEVIRPGDTLTDGTDEAEADELDLTAEGWKVWPAEWNRSEDPSNLRHAKPHETIEDVRGDISNDPCGYFGKGSDTSCDGCPRDGKGGGCSRAMSADLVRRAYCSRAMSADLVRRAYECGKRDGGDDARD